MVKLSYLPGTLFSCRACYNFGGRARRARSRKILISGLPLRPMLWPLILRFCLKLVQYAWIWAILLRFEPYCLDLGYWAEFESK